jgi:hypothetical protein
MFTGFIQHKCNTLQEAQKLQGNIKNKTFIQPEIFKIQQQGNNFFLVVETPNKLMVDDIEKIIT